MLDTKNFAHHNSMITSLVSWALLSEKGKAITTTEWYKNKSVIPAVESVNQAVQTHTVHHEQSPFSTSILAHVEHYLRTHNTSAFLVMHKGKLVHSYYKDFEPNGVFNSMSLVKTVLGLCIGIAIDRGFIRGIDDPAHWYLHEWKHDGRQHISIDHLLTMQSGLHSDVAMSAHKILMPIIPLQFGKNLHKTALSIPAVSPPGYNFEYNNYNSQLLGIILERASGMTFPQFIHKYLWQPLQGGEAFCYTDNNGQSQTFAGFFARPVDWVKLGWLFVTGGVYNDVQVVPKSWIQTMTTPMNTVHNGVKNAHADYGRHIWLDSHHYGVVSGIPRMEGWYAKNKFVDESMVCFEGMRGQYIFASPDHELVVMRMGEKPQKSWDASYVINTLVNKLV